MKREPVFLGVKNKKKWINRFIWTTKMKPQTSKSPKLITLTKGYIFCKILWLGEGDGARKKMKNEAASNKMKKKEKGKRRKGKGESDFFC